MSAGPASHDRPTPPRGDEGELFARHHAALLRAVRRAVRAPKAVIEDACASAWAILLRRQPDRGPALFGWLRTVAIREGYRLSREQRRVGALDDLAAVEGEGWEAFVADRRTLDASLEARRALRVLAALPERQRRYLALLAAGYRYHEIVEHAGVTYTNVNKDLAKARASHPRCRVRGLREAHPARAGPTTAQEWHACGVRSVGDRPRTGGATDPKGRCLMARHTNSDAERDARRQADRERLERAARALLDSEGWQRWVRVRATNGLARYSFGNQLLIALQKPDATFVAGFRAFLKLNRCVRKGEKSIRILAPMTVRRRGADDTNEDDDKRTVFRAVLVFDVGQTDPLPGREPIALEPPCEPISGDSHARLLTPLENLAAGLGYSIRHLPLDGGADGWCDAQRCEIVVNDHLPVNAQVRVLVPWRSGWIPRCPNALDLLGRPA